MTEQEWVTSTSPNPMLIHLRPWHRHRKKLILYVCAHWRHSWRMLNEECRRLLELCENHAYGAVDVAEWKAAKRAVSRAADREWEVSGYNGLADVGRGLLLAIRLDHLPGWEGMEPRESYFTGTDEQREAVERDRQVFIVRTVQFLRCIFGNPFRHVSCPAIYRTQTVTSLAEGCFEDRSFPEGVLDNNRLSILADALEDAGCTDTDILAHLRGPGPHVRGCHVLDLLLNKT